MFDLLQYEFMRNALMAALLVSLACGIVGTFVVVKRIVFVSGGISHAAFGGIGLGYWLGINPLLAVIPFSLLAAFGLGLISRATRVSEDSAIGILWTIGMAVGILFVQLTPGYAPDLMSYLFGSILTVPRADLVLMLALDLVILLVTVLLHREFIAVSFDEEFAAVVGVATRVTNVVLLCLVALSVVVLIRVVGVILVIALLTLPATIARQFTHHLGKLMALASLVGAALTCAGLWVSYVLDLSSGATIILVMSAAFFATSLATRPRPARSLPGNRS
ncbi:MAG: metal ABC transporter permease [Candidatus Latescibacterota bacterium]|jgi:zinc transport system permease protein